MEKMRGNRWKLNVAGHNKPLFVVPEAGRCGDVVGPRFWFGGEGKWVVDVNDLRALVAAYDAQVPPAPAAQGKADA